MLQQKSTYLVCVIAFSFVLFACKKKGGSDAPPAVVPVIKIEDASQTRTTNDGVMFFTISLNKTTTVPVMVDYTLVNGTATSPKDYTAASGGPGQLPPTATLKIKNSGALKG